MFSIQQLHGNVKRPAKVAKVTKCTVFTPLPELPEGALFWQKWPSPALRASISVPLAKPLFYAVYTALCLDRRKCQMVAVSHLQDEKDSASGGVETCYHKGSKTPERSTLYEDLLLHPPALGRASLCRTAGRRDRHCVRRLRGIPHP